MQLRRLRSHRLTLLAAGALLASPLLGGCGFDYATDRVNVISAGISDRSGAVDVLGAVVVAGEDNAGVFVATLVNKDTSEPIELTGVQSSETVQAVGEAEPVEIAANGRASLFQTGGLAITGTFKAGDFLPVTLAFSNGEVTTLNVSVVPPCHQYSLDKLTELDLPAAPAEEPTLDPGTGTEDAAPEEGTIEELEADADETEAEAARYSCDALPPVEHHGGGEGGEGEGAEGEATE